MEKNNKGHAHGDCDHDRDHKKWSRRNFIKASGASAGLGLFLSQLPVYALGKVFSEDDISGNEDRILIQLTLNGGCDGLNTIIPIKYYDTYRKLRPTIHYKENELISLNSEYSIPKEMESLLSLWNKGQMKVVHGMGYEDQNLSHFRSQDIWDSASDADVIDKSGWLGRFIESEYPNITNNPPEHPPAIEIGGNGYQLFNNYEGNNSALSASKIQTLIAYAEKGDYFSLNNLPECAYGDKLEYLRIIANSTYKYSKILKDAYDKGRNNVTYEEGIGKAFELIARFIAGGLRTRMYHVTISGFDTHAQQKEQLPILLKAISKAISSFITDAEKGGYDNRVLIMTQSEFGRRPYENGSFGTDHGAAAPLLVFGTALQGSGFLSEQPSLRDFDVYGNLQYNVDFRRIYATVLQNWFCVDALISEHILEGQFDPLDLGLECHSTSTGSSSVFTGISCSLRQLMNGEAILVIHLQQEQNIRYRLYDLNGRSVQKQELGYYGRGEHQFVISTQIQTGYYILKTHVGRAEFSHKVFLG